jgi:hypothetical protein
MAVPNSSFSDRLADQFVVERRKSNVHALTKYFGHRSSVAFDGSFFETYEQRNSDANGIAAADIVAVTLLSMEIRRQSRSGISTETVLLLEKLQPRINTLLSKIPENRELHTFTDREFDKHLGAESPATRLFDLLRHDAKMHRVAAFKLLARKRPGLLPIKDSRTVRLLGNPPNWWKSWHHALTAEPTLAKELKAIRKEASKSNRRISRLSLLRIADIALWNS